MSRWFILSAAALLLSAGASLYVYAFHLDGLPAQLPMHWNIEGEPDGWMQTSTALLVWPAITAGVVLLTLALPWLSPKQFEIESFRDTYGYVMALVACLMTYMHLVVLAGSFQLLHTDRWLFGGLFLLFALIGNVLGKVRRNFWMGVRTPWTLASDAVWIQTHRLAAWLFTAFGVGGFLAMLLGAPLMWCFVGLFVSAMTLVLYSLLLYKRLEKQGRL
jgi:uncharacterized membrane protein